MATGIRLTGNAAGCPPYEQPPSSYQNPFREDSSGRLWINACFSGFRYFGAARHDTKGVGVPGNDLWPVNTSGNFVNGVGVRAGTYKTRTITNNTNCTMGILLGHNIATTIESKLSNMILLALDERWNGKSHSVAAVSTEYQSGNGSIQRQLLNSGANPHDVGADASGGSSLQLAPGESATVGARLYLRYSIGSPAPGERIFNSYSAVRIYGYVLG